SSRENPDAHEGRGLAIEANVLLIVLGAKDNIGNLAQANDNPLIFLDYQLPEFIRCPKIGVGNQIHRHHGTLGLANRGKMVVLRECIPHCRSGNTKRSHFVWLQPDSHSESTIAEDVRALYAADRT